MFNQVERVLDVCDIAQMVHQVGREFALHVQVQTLENPRQEPEEHYYNPDHQLLFDLGYKPTHSIEDELRIMLTDLLKYRSRIEARREVFIPDVRWDGRRQKVNVMSSSAQGRKS